MQRSYNFKLFVMTYKLPILFLFCTIFISCKNSAIIPDSKSCVLSGTYFNQTVLSDCTDSLPGLAPYFALEISFVERDSVDLNTGVEHVRLGYSQHGEKDCDYKISGATQFGDMYFTAEGDSVLHLTDSAWTKVNGASLFQRERNESRSNWEFDNYYNECFIAGTYKMTKPEPRPNPIYFLPNGQVTGIKPYLAFSLCYAGDCLEETAEPSNIIEMTTDRGTRELFVIKTNDDHSVIHFYKVGEPIQDIKGQRSIGDLAFELKSEMQ